jgi:hypothetical protein
MKKVFQKLMFVAAVGTIGFLYSCGEDEETLPVAPSLNVSATSGSGSTVTSGGSIQATDSITFSFTASTPGGFNTFRVTSPNISTPFEVNRNDLGVTAEETSPQLPQYTVYTDASLEGASISLRFELVDESGQVDSTTFAFDVTAAPEPEVDAFNAVLLFAPLQDASSETWFSTNLGRAVTEAEVNASAAPNSSDIDFGYYYGNTDEASIASPNNYPTLGGSIDISDWNTRNATTFRSTTLTAAQFLEIATNADVDDAWNNGTDEGEGITGLVAGQVFAFELDADKSTQRGLARVVGITGTFNQGDNIELEILIQSTGN